MEFDIINEYFNWKNPDKSIILGVGDDCGIFQNPHKMIISTDTFIEGVHFFKGASPADIAYKALAVNLSDIAAMGGVPKYFNLAISLPDINKNWLAEFSKSLQTLANDFNVSLIGGDTTKGCLSITITIIGECEHPLLRSGAKVGDSIFVSGELGGAKLALEQIKKQPTSKEIIDIFALQQLNRPLPQVELGQKIATQNGGKNYANSCIDISDGLVADLGHILKASGVGANLDSSLIPIFNHSNLDYALYGGDDYQLCWTGKHNDFGIKIGKITQCKEFKIDNQVLSNSGGYKHF